MNKLRMLADQLRFAAVTLARCSTWSDRRRFASYLVRRQLGLADPSRRWTLNFKDMSLTFNEVDSQLAGYFEIIIDRIYDRSDAVIAKAGWTVVDVGANIGMFTIWEARRGARVIAYEPHPRAFTNLLTNLDANGVRQLVTCHRVAIASSAGTAWLAADTGATAAHLTEDRSRQGYEVETVTLDESLAAYGLDGIDLLKVDVEGAELEVIAGAGATLEKTKAAIIEVHDGISPGDVDAQMARHGLTRDPAGQFPNLYYARVRPINRTA